MYLQQKFTEDVGKKPLRLNDEKDDKCDMTMKFG
jgi:hypothetical protein